jgi:hypothetical protein
MQCSAFGCDRSAVAMVLMDVDGTGQRIWLYWCARHKRPSDWEIEPNPAPVAIAEPQATEGKCSTIDEIPDTLKE